MDGISALIRRGQRAPSLSFHHVGEQEMGHLQPGRGSLPEPDHAGTLMADLQPPVNKEISVIYTPLSLWYFFIRAAQTE